MKGTNSGTQRACSSTFIHINLSRKQRFNPATFALFAELLRGCDGEDPAKGLAADAIVGKHFAQALDGRGGHLVLRLADRGEFLHQLIKDAVEAREDRVTGGSGG